MNSSGLTLTQIIYNASSLIAGVGSAALGFFVYCKDKKRELNKRYLLMSLTLALWGSSLFLWGVSSSPQIALLWARILHIGATFIPITNFHFITELLGITKEKRKTIIIGYIVSIIIAATAFTNLFIKGVEDKFLFKLWPIPGVIYPFFLLLFFIYLTYSLCLVFKAFKNTTGFTQQQLKYVFLGLMVALIGGATNYPLFYNIHIIPVGNFFVFTYVILYTYTIAKHHLMDIEVFIKKSLIFAGTFIFSFGVFVAVTLLVSHLIGGGRFFSLAISSVIIIIGLRPIENWLVNATDKFLFQKKYEYKQILKKFIDDVITVLNLDEVVNSTLKLLDDSLHPYNVSIFILNRVDDKYNLYSSLGLENKDLAFTSESKLVYFLKKTHNPAVIKQVDEIKGADSLVALEMEELKAVLVLPLLLHDDLIGFISLGRKKSDEDYTKDDLDVLLDLARTESIAVGNAQLITEVAQTERRAAIGTMAAGINHEIGNPINIINTKIQFFLLSSQRGLFKDKTKEEIMQECSAILNETIKQTNRISEITRKLANFAKPSKEFKPELVDVSEQVEETLSMLGHDLELGKIQIEKNISSGLYKIMADKREIQQIFFNIIRNAAQAIEGSGKIIISAANTPNDKVHIEVQDTGKGIPEDKMQRIFEPFFTTKAANQGTGLGLSIVRQLVWKNKGEISFKSQPQVGTVFVLEFLKGV